MFVTFILLCSFQGIIVCEDVLIVSLAPDRTDNGYLVYFRVPNLIPTSKDDPLTFSFTNTTSVKELDYDPLVKTLFMIDILSNLYITENFTDNIQASRLTDNVINTSSSQSSKIAIDWISKNIYHIDPSYNWIILKPLNAVHSSNRKTLIDGLVLPKAIAVDPLNGYLFWSSEHSGRSAIWTSTLSGSNQTLLMPDLLLVTDIVLIDTERRIYWLDIGRGTLETCGYDGSNRRVLRRSPSLLMSMSGLTLHKDVICFTVQLAYFVECIDKHTGQSVWEHLFQWPKDGKYEYKIPQALRFLEGTKQDNRSSFCEDKDCEYLCIASKEGGATCMCPDGFTLDESGINCTQNTILHQKSLLLLNSSSICFVDVLALTGLPIHVECILHWNRSISHFVVDAHQDKICFEDNDDKKLMMLDMKSGVTTDLMSVSGVSGLCVDWVNGNIYWSEKNSGLIMFINERFPMEMPIFQNVDHPFSLTIDPLNRTLYWISGTVGTFQIEAGTSDGNEKWTAVNTIHLKYPDELFVDVTSNRLFWKDIDGVYSMNLENCELQSFPSNSIRSFTKYKNYLLLLKNEGEVRVSDIKAPGIHRQLNMPVFTNAIVYDKSEQPLAKDHCSVRNGDCEHTCIPNPDGTRDCKCRLGFKMKTDQKSCESFPLQSSFVLTVDFTHATIFQVSMVDANVVAIDVNETIRPVNAIFHPRKHDLIYSDAMFREIRQLSMSGHESITLTHTGQFEPHALVIEPSTGHLIYSAVSTKSYIGILNIETKERKTVVPGLTSVYNIAIHPKKGYLFWSDLVYSASYIGRSYLDGSAMINLIFNDISQPNSLTLDYRRDLLYWTDGELSTINYCDLDGGSRGVLLQGNRQKFMQFDISGDYFYYTSLDDQKITKASLSNAKEVTWMSYLANFGKLQSLKAYGENIIPVNDVCSVANGRCSTFCLPSFRYRKCACPDGVKLLADKRTCSGVVKCPEDIPNGQLKSECAPYIGNTCTYTCNPGFTARGSSQRISCLGTWNVSSLDTLCVKVPTQRQNTDPTNDGAIAGGIVAASLAVTLVLVLIIIFLCRRASDSPSPDSGAIHYTYGTHVNGNLSGTRKVSRVTIEEVASNSRSSS